MICDEWDVVVVPFPFVDAGGSKRRPALVVSRRAFGASGHSVLAMITSAARRSWPGDVYVTDLQAAGLHVSCLFRLKLFTLDDRLILRRIGRLSETDRESVAEVFRAFLI